MIGNRTALAIAVACAAACGSLLFSAFLRSRRLAQRKRTARELAAQSAEETLFSLPESTGLAHRVLLTVQRESRAEQGGASMMRLPFSDRFDPGERLLMHAGMSGPVTVRGVRLSRMKLAVGGTAVGGVTGAVFTAELAVLGMLAGACIGFALPGWALKREARTRSEDAERHLSEMIEVVMLGMHSGLSLEKSFALYPRYFDTALAHSVAKTVSQWETGLVQREEALRNLAAQYDSVLLDRVVESAIRSLRFGSPLADALEASAVESRALHRARMEERIAKAPVKMMLPVGTLILPAMLLLVMGPVILELMTEF